MANATPVHRTADRTSLTKAVMGMGLRQSQQQCRVAIWASKPSVAGSLA